MSADLRTDAPPGAGANDTPRPSATVAWADPTRAQAFQRWFERVAEAHGLVANTLRTASADASFRRYLRVAARDGGSRIVMDAPPAHENCAPFVQVAQLMQAAGLNVPHILDWHETDGFMLLTDLGQRTMMDVLDREHPDANRSLYSQALDALLGWQQASRPGQLPPYDEALLRRELSLFPDWYLARHRGVTLDQTQAAALAQSFDAIVARNRAAPMVYVHRDFMPRNLMAPIDGRALGVLDFQDAVYGPMTYDIASLMRDAFLSWDEEFVLDVTVRYWERARKLGLMDFEGWHADFGSFWRAVEWMGLQRHLKVAGIFARLTLRDGKPRYLDDAPRFIGYIRHTASRYRELTPLLRLLDDVEGKQATTGWAFGRL